MSSISFTVPGIPIAKARAKAGRDFNTGKLRMRTPSPTKVYEQLVKRTAIAAMDGRPMLEGPLFVEMTIYRPIQKGRSIEFHENAESIWHCIKPDGDNCIKGIFDGMNQAIYKDDARIASCFYKKTYSKKPRVEITIREMQQWEPQKKKKKNGPQTMWSAGQLTPLCLTQGIAGLIARSKLGS